MEQLSFKRALAACLLILLSASPGLSRGGGAILSGAGATFPYPIYSRWAYEYEKTSGVRINYQSIGSGGGIRQIRAGTVDFGASDAPLTAEELERSGLVQFPMVIGGVVPVVNLKGVSPGKLRLTGEVLAALYLGAIRYWDDGEIRRLNPGLRLPHQRVTVVHRSDGSGTTWIFTSYLSKASDVWAKKVGVGKAVHWPTGIGGKGNEGVAAYVMRIRGAVGYVEYAYAVQNRLSYVLLRNRAGEWVGPSIESFQAAALSADWEGTPGMGVSLVDRPGEGAWPIAGATFILVPKRPEHPDRLARLLRFFDWCYRSGGDAAKELYYVPLPEEVVELVEALWSKEILDPDGRPVWKGCKGSDD